MKPYKCGQCGYLSERISDLHEHLVNHEEIIGYFFHIGDRTAFPKRHYFDIQTQTCEQEISAILHNIEDIRIKTENDTLVEAELESGELQDVYGALSQESYSQEIHVEQFLIKQDTCEESETDFMCDTDSSTNKKHTFQNTPAANYSHLERPRNSKGKFVSNKKKSKSELAKKRNSNTFKRILICTPAENSTVKTRSEMPVKQSASTGNLQGTCTEHITETNDKKEKYVMVNASYNVCKQEDGTEDYSCTICSYNSHTECDIQVHMSSHYKKSADIVMCELCGKTFSSKPQLYNHRKICCKKYKCDICNTKYSCSTKLNEHLRVHSGETPYICDQCGKSFKTSGSLARHKLFIHSSVKNYKCDQCEKSFKLSELLKRHIRTHLNITPHCCDFCGKGFSTRWNMKAHMRQHNGDKPYSCSKCGEQFAHNVSRKNHEVKCLFISPESS